MLKNDQSLHCFPLIWQFSNTSARSENVLVWGGWVRQRCRLSQFTEASNWDWFTVEQCLLSLQLRVEEEYSYFFCFFTVIHFPLSTLSLSFIASIISFLFSLSLGDNIKWSTRVYMSLNSNTIKLTCSKLRRSMVSFIFVKWSRHTWRSGVRSAMHAASQLFGRGPTDVDVAPVPAC